MKAIHWIKVKQIKRLKYGTLLRKQGKFCMYSRGLDSDIVSWEDGHWTFVDLPESGHADLVRKYGDELFEVVYTPR